MARLLHQTITFKWRNHFSPALAHDTVRRTTDTGKEHAQDALNCLLPVLETTAVADPYSTLFNFHQAQR